MLEKILKKVNILLLSLAFIGGLLFVPVLYFFQASLSQLEGEIVLGGLKNNVTILRDINGVPTIKAHTRRDTAFALGFLHGQERYFQMDLLRRSSAGQLSELFGEQAFSHDKKIRTHQFRQRAIKAFKNMPKIHQGILIQYTKGVNEGLAHLAQMPFEYFLLRGNAVPWKTEDSLLVLYTMYMDLQPIWGQSERSLAVMKDLLPTDWFEFLSSKGGYWDAPIEGAAYTENRLIPKKALHEFENKKPQVSHSSVYQDKIHYGSNNWSVAGDLTHHGSGMVANDMHLGLGVPNIWYRASWYLDDGRRITGVTLPGTPAMITGSNEHIAWGFTNSQGDYSDVIVLNTRNNDQYQTVQGWKDFKLENEKIAIKDKGFKTIEVRNTQWGPVIGKDHNGAWLALRWVALDVEGANMNILKMENAHSVQDALAIAPFTGIPGQNLNVVDDKGQNAWSIMGRLPNRFGFTKSTFPNDFFESQLPKDWSKGNLGWQGYLDDQNHPQAINPNSGRIWTANARVASGINLAKVGVNNYALGARQKQIGDQLQKSDQFSELDFLNIQLDDRALFLERWQKLMLHTLNNADLNTLTKELNDVKIHVDNWQGRASESSVGYLLVKRFRERVINQTIGHVYRFLENNAADFWPSSINNLVEYPVWLLMQEKPAQHIPSGFSSWQGFSLKMIEQTYEKVTKDGEPLNKQTWGKYNTLAIKHPLSGAVPLISFMLDMPKKAMAGDTYMPRVQDPNTGASERFVVAPGFEALGYFHMPAGQSAHPLSPYFKAGHEDWVNGRASPFLPQKTNWTLKLYPQLSE